MKRILIIVGVVVLVLVVGVVAVVAATFIGRRSITDGQDLGGARIVADGFSSIAIVPVGEKRVLLVDAGQDTRGEAIRAALSRDGLSPDAVVAVLVTHGHADHTGALKLFPKAEIMALEREVPVVEGREGTHGPVTRLFPVSPAGITVTRALHDGDTVTVGDKRVRVFAVPGHTAGSAAYLVDGLLFVGDSADVTSEGAIQGAPWIFSDSQADNVASLRGLVERLSSGEAAVRTIVPAHSGPVDGLAPLAAFASATGP
jgi:hydroxyacylglutathione hydrolase